MFERLRNLLSPPEHKSSRTARLIALESGGRARWTPRDYAALAREGYTKNAIVHRAVRLVAESLDALVWAVTALSFWARGEPRVRGL
jgi:phage portal protein BeeE